MTLASHARGPEFEPRCEYSHFFFRRKNIEQQQNQKSREKYSFLPLHRAHLSHCLLLIQEALVMIQACIMCLPRIDWVWKFRIQVFSKLVESVYSGLGSTHTYSVPQTLLRIVNILCEQRKNQNNNKKILSENVVGKKKLVGFVMAPKHLAAPGDSARPGPRSWSASKPSAWPMDVAQTIQLISFVTM